MKAEPHKFDSKKNCWSIAVEIYWKNSNVQRVVALVDTGVEEKFGSGSEIDK